jgi:hypothetical protein
VLTDAEPDGLETRAEEPDRETEPDEDPPEPELALEPLRDDADPELLPADEEGVREPACGSGRGASDARTGSGYDLELSAELPDEPDDEEPDPAGGVRGIAWANEMAGTASARAKAATTSERGFLSISMHSFNGSQTRQGGSCLLTLQQYCHQ